MKQTPNKTLLRHLAALVELYPVTDNQDAVLEVLEYCRRSLVATGSFADAALHSSKGFHSLTASTQGTKIPKLLLQAHVDVVAAPRSAQQLVINGDRIEGRGVFDMLFAVATYLAFAEEHSKDLPNLDIGIMLTGDEELGGYNGVQYLMNEGYGAEVCILPDAGEGWSDLNVGAKGVYNFDLIVSGKAHHGSRPWEGDGAANKLVTLLQQLTEAFDGADKQASTLTVTRLSAGDADNKGPSEATAHLDIRYPDAKEYVRIKSLLVEICEQYDARIERVTECDDYRIDPENEYFKQFAKLYQDHCNKPLRFSTAPGSSDAVYFVAEDIPVLMLRPDGSGAHADQELLSLKSLEKFYSLCEAYTLQTAKIKA